MKIQNSNNLKQILKLAIDTHVPEILQGKADIELLIKEKQELQVKIDALNIELEEEEEQLAKQEDYILDIMAAHNIKKMATPKYAVERCRNANPSVIVNDIKNVPKRYIIEKPHVDKRAIQSEYVNQKIIPPGVTIEYGQYLTIIERSKD